MNIEKPTTPEIEKLEGIDSADISREIVAPEMTEVILQRHEKYIRDKDDENAGSLYEEAAKRAYEQTKEIFGKKLEGLSPEERAEVAVLVVASDTKYEKGMRSMETAAIVSKAINDIIAENRMSGDQLLNNATLKVRDNEERKRFKGDAVRPFSGFREPGMFENNPEFVEFLRKEYGEEFWPAFEEDRAKETRERMGAEGPLELLARFKKYLKVLEKYAGMYHRKNPQKRLIIWTVSHYDVVSPFVKNEVLGKDTRKAYLPVGYGGGVSVKIDQDGKKTCALKGEEYEIAD